MKGEFPKTRELVDLTQNTRRRAPAKIIRQIRRAIEVANMTNACFGFSSEHVTVSGMGKNDPSMTVDAFVKETTRLYRESYLLPPLHDLLAWAEGTDA